MKLKYVSTAKFSQLTVGQMFADDAVGRGPAGLCVKIAQETDRANAIQVKRGSGELLRYDEQDVDCLVHQVEIVF